MGQLWALSADAYNRALATRNETGRWPPLESADLPELNQSQNGSPLYVRVSLTMSCGAS
jgi:hypothetical protein